MNKIVPKDELAALHQSGLKEFLKGKEHVSVKELKQVD
jgi:hypothetical protein